MASREDRKREIIHASCKVFREYGFHHAKMEEIAKEAGVGKGTIYQYFDSKQSLFQEMIKYNINRFKEGMKTSIKKENTIKGKLIAIADFHCEFLSKHLDMAQMIANQSGMISKDMKLWLLKGRNEIFTLIEGVIGEGIASGELREDLNKEIATFSVIGTIGQYYAKRVFIDRDNKDNIKAASIVETLMQGLGK